MRFDTRRGQLKLERVKEMIKFLLFIVLTAALLITTVWTLACAGRKAPEKKQSAETAESAELPRGSLADVQTYPRLVNSEHLLPADYEPPQLTYLRGIPDGTSVQLNFDAATAFTKLFDDMVSQGLGIIPLSGYRTYVEQTQIFDYNIKLHMAEGMSEEDARAYTLRFVAIPGSSEHQYGRSIDVTIDGTTNHSFQTTDQGKWLISHAWEYGFIIRYPSDKEAITGIAYEPWHLRYVGVDTAKYISDNHLCLEEYIELVKKDNPGARSEE